MKKLITIILITAFLLESTEAGCLSSVLSPAALAKQDALRPVAEARSGPGTSFQAAKGLIIYSGSTKEQESEFFERPRKPKRFKLMAVNKTVFPGQQQVYIKRIKYIVGVMEGLMWTLTLAAASSFTVAVASGNMWVAFFVALLWASFGTIVRTCILAYYHFVRGINFPRKLYFYAAIPKAGSFFTIAILTFPDTGIKSINDIRNIYYQVCDAFHKSRLDDVYALQELRRLKEGEVFISEDILRYQDRHFGQDEDRSRRSFMVRSARAEAGDLVEFFEALQAGKRLLFIGTTDDIKQLSDRLKEQYGPANLWRIYFYDINAFLKDFSNQSLSADPKWTCVRHMFPEFGSFTREERYSLASPFVDKRLDIDILKFLVKRQDQSFTLEQISEGLDYGPDEDAIRERLRFLCSRGFVIVQSVLSQDIRRAPESMPEAMDGLRNSAPYASQVRVMYAIAGAA